MRHLTRTLAAAAVATWIGLTAAPRAVAAELSGPSLQPAAPAAEKPAAEKPVAEKPVAEKPVAEKPVARPIAKPAPKPILSPEQEALRDRLRRVLAAYFHQPINTTDNTPADIMLFCLAFGCDTEVRYGDSAGSSLNGIGCLCWNYPCAGYQLLMAVEDRVVARVGYGLQDRPSQLLATLALSGVPAEYEIRIGKHKATVAQLVAAEKLDCRPATDLSGKLVGLAFYVDNGQEWKDRLGETWNIERMVKEELGRSPAQDNADVVNQLMGLSSAVQRQLRRNEPLAGQFLRASDYVASCQKHALGLQNSDGSWHPAFLALRGASNDWTGALRATGHLSAWLAFSLPEDRLRDPRLSRSIGYITEMLEGISSRWNASAATPREIDAVMHAAHALRMYDRRMFKPADHSDGAPHSASPALRQILTR